MKNNYIIVFVIANNVIFLLYFFVCNKYSEKCKYINSIVSSKANVIIEDNLYPRLWSCRYNNEK